MISKEWLKNINKLNNNLLKKLADIHKQRARLRQDDDEKDVEDE